MDEPIETGEVMETVEDGGQVTPTEDMAPMDQETSPDVDDTLNRELGDDLGEVEAEPGDDQPDAKTVPVSALQKMRQRAQQSEEQLQRLQWQMQQYQQQQQWAQQQAQQGGQKTLDQMTDEEILILQSESPRQYQHMLEQQIAAKSQQAATMTTQRNLWMQRNSDFQVAAQDGTLQQFITRKAAETGIQFDPITGYYEYKIESVGKDRFDEGYKKAIADIKAKRQAAGQLGAGGTPADRTAVHTPDWSKMTDEDRRQATVAKVMQIRKKSAGPRW